MSTAGTSMRSPRFRSQLLRQIAANKNALEFLADPEVEERQVAFENILLSLIPHATTASEKQNIFRSFLSWCNDQTLDCPEEVKEAIRIRTGRKMKQRKTKRNFISRVGLNWGREEREEYLSQIPTTTVTELSAPYPPLSHWVYESDEIRKKWEYWIKQARQADARKKRLPMLKLDPSKLVHDIDADTSMIFFDNHGKIAGLVIRNFCGDDDVLTWLDGIIEGAVGNRKSIRLEDPGALVQIGYSAGSRSSPAFDWVKNLLSKKHSPEDKAAMDVSESSAFALVWNMIRSRLPDEILNDFDEFSARTNIKRMDADGLMVDPAGGTFYSIVAGDDTFVFHGAELAPPAGVFGKNYSRAIHYEHHPHRFGVALTVSRSHPAEAGGHFYMSKYGIRIAGAPDSLVAWIPTEPHGTSLQNFSPEDAVPDFFQKGLAFVTSARLPKIWARYQNAEFSHAAALKALREDVGSGDEKFE